MKRIYVVRHCSATGQPPDAELTATGRGQAALLADFLMNKEIEYIVSSPFARARQSIEPFASRLNIPVHVDERLSERVLAAHHLDNWVECLERTFENFELAFEGGETSQVAMNRAVACVQEVLWSDASNVVLVTHGNLMALLLRHFDNSFGFREWTQFTNPDVYLVCAVKGPQFPQATVERVWGPA